MEAESKKENAHFSPYSEGEEMSTGSMKPFAPEVLNTERFNFEGDEILAQGNGFGHGTRNGSILEQETGLETALGLLKLNDNQPVPDSEIGHRVNQTRSAVVTQAASGQPQQVGDPTVVNKDNLGFMVQGGSSRETCWDPVKTHEIVEDPKIKVQFFWVGTLDLD